MKQSTIHPLTIAAQIEAARTRIEAANPQFNMTQVRDAIYAEVFGVYDPKKEADRRNYALCY